ncbi:MAG: 7-carboxy-7-deazaguanine synthase [Gemmatimonadetes bacterium RBG_16_66_8]|nr:MAG: 7-carboxy-7-deazaguanine synthase [Gemmatimonadetes bacterium RBG_16_66_8]
MTYSIKEIYYTLQGEGAQTGRPAVFLRFAGCNLWSGHEADRQNAVCRFCDTDFVNTDGPGGGKFSRPADVAVEVADTWPNEFSVVSRPFVVCTGGEPLLQLDEPLIEALHQRGFEIAIETNGTLRAPSGIDWICVSPKAEAQLVQQSGHELKLVYPQDRLDPAVFEALEFTHFSLQPMDGPERERNTELALQYCAAHPKWRLSLQTHKLLGMP